MQLQDHFLIAMPHLEDSYFYRSVIYVCEHNDKGSMGLVLTQPTDLPESELIVKMNFMMTMPRMYPQQLVLAGGPVNEDRGFILHRPTERQFEHSYKLTERLQLTTSADIIGVLGTQQAPEKYLIALGCASWLPNQLEQEIADNSWLVAPADEQILFDIPYEQRWLAANALLGIQRSNLIHQVGRC